MQNEKISSGSNMQLLIFFCFFFSQKEKVQRKSPAELVVCLWWDVVGVFRPKKAPQLHLLIFYTKICKFLKHGTLLSTLLQRTMTNLTKGCLKACHWVQCTVHKIFYTVVVFLSSTCWTEIVSNMNCILVDFRWSHSRKIALVIYRPLIVPRIIRTKWLLWHH